MSLWIKTKGFYYTLLENGDSRVEGWFLMDSPFPTLAVCLAYVFIVKFLGPAFMKDRKPLNLRMTMVFYNLFMMLYSLYIFLKMGYHGWFGKYNYVCQPVDYSDHPDAIGMVDASYWYYISKFVEFTDTLFFVLRKKDSHVSTLHVVHHGLMPLSVWWGVKFTPGGHSTFFSFINSLVHVLMYTYYGLSALGPHMAKYLWWKKHITTVQMIQFIFIFVHSFQLLFTPCNYPRSFMYWIGAHAILFWFLFMDFYKSAYSLKKAKRKLSPKSVSEASKIQNGHTNNSLKHHGGEALHGSPTTNGIKHD